MTTSESSVPAGPYESPAEQLFAEAWNRRFAAIPLIPQYWIQVRDRVTGEVHRYRADFAFPKKQLIIEIDGWSYHGKTSEQFDAHEIRHQRLDTAGWKVFRFTANQVRNDPDDCAYRAWDYLLSQQSPARPRPTHSGSSVPSPRPAINTLDPQPSPPYAIPSSPALQSGMDAPEKPALGRSSGASMPSNRQPMSMTSSVPAYPIPAQPHPTRAPSLIAMVYVWILRLISGASGALLGITLCAYFYVTQRFGSDEIWSIIVYPGSGSMLMAGLSGVMFRATRPWWVLFLGTLLVLSVSSGSVLFYQTMVEPIETDADRIFFAVVAIIGAVAGVLPAWVTSRLGTS